MLEATYCRYILDFKTPGGTSRGVLKQKETFFIKVWNKEFPECFGIGECAVFRGLSADDYPDYEGRLSKLCSEINETTPDLLSGWSSLKFGLETALTDLQNGGTRCIFNSDFIKRNVPIEINGLVWMGDKETMRKRIEEKLNAGFRCIKLKIGAIDFESELSLLNTIRSRFGCDSVELRVDANGAFSSEEAPARLEALSRYALHSIEQPIRRGQWDALKILCRNTPIPIALDEELIGLDDKIMKEDMLRYVNPQYVVLKPALVGGFSGASEWIELAVRHQVGWWVTSALESNIGLNAIAQFTSSYHPVIPQGLGTGMLYTNNIVSPLRQEGSVLTLDPLAGWDFSRLKWK